jgi:hypothetical protein
VNIQEVTEIEVGLAKLIDRRPACRGHASGLVIVPVVDPRHLGMLALPGSVEPEFPASTYPDRISRARERGATSQLSVPIGACSGMPGIVIRGQAHAADAVTETGVG